ncbi:MAG: hypothetical protein COA78_04340 [Blastopirellula sp.]|nr:MAG: hypothetical protein COA78_04340 [Blastopirellula sp.]
MLKRYQEVNLMKFISAIFSWILEELQWRFRQLLWRSFGSEFEKTKAEWQAERLELRSAIKYAKESGAIVELVVIPRKLKLTAFYPNKCHKKDFNGVPTNVSYSSWIGFAYFPFLKKHLLISVSVCDTKPTEFQMQFLKSLVLEKRDLRKHINGKIYEYYQSEVYGNRTIIDWDFQDITEKCVPKITEPSQLWKLISDPGIDSVDEEANQFTLGFRCSWEDDKRLKVKLKDWEVINIWSF